MITELTPDEVISYCRSVLGLETDNAVIDDALLAALLRRCAGFLCPCSRASLRVTLFDSMSHLGTDTDTLADRIDSLIEDMLVVGDLLELSDVATEDPNVRGTWIFAAPPSFVVRKNGSIYLTGLVPDQDSFLPASLESRILYSRVTRSIISEPQENLSEILVESGLNQLSESVWLKTPDYQSPEQLITKFEERLAGESLCGPIQDIQILDPATKVNYYRGRWGAPKKQTGTFVARRPREFGAPIWSFVELNDGEPQRIIDLPMSNYRWRGCDAAWHLQMAIDYCRKFPQQYRRQTTSAGICLDFFSPLPLWSERRLMIFGQKIFRKNSLFSYEISMPEVGEEERYLQECLWLIPENSKT